MSASMFDSCFMHRFDLDYLETEKLAIGRSVSSGHIRAAGNRWTIECYPRGCKKVDNGEYLSIFLHHGCSNSKDTKVIFEAFVMGKDGTPTSTHRNRMVFALPPKDDNINVFGPVYKRGWDRFVERSILESLYLTLGSFFVIMCGVKVVAGGEGDPIEVPPSDMGIHLGLLLDSADGFSDVLVLVAGKKFPAHRAVLAARSPVFKAQLLDSMVDAKMPSITLHDIAPATFRAMLRFMYTDACPADEELGKSPSQMFLELLAAADRFALDRLKLLCGSKLWDNVSVATVAATLLCAETYNCPELKKKCIDFLGNGKDFKTKALLTESFAQLVQKFPSILDELREKVGA